MSLIELPKQTKATIDSVHINDSHRNILEAVGIAPHRSITKLTQLHAKGPVIVQAAHHSNFALGYDLAACINVTIEK